VGTGHWSEGSLAGLTIPPLRRNRLARTRPVMVRDRVKVRVSDLLDQ